MRAKMRHAAVQGAGKALGLAAALGVVALAGCAGPMSRTAAISADSEYLSAASPNSGWYGRAGGLTGSERVEHLATGKTSTVMAVPSKAREDFTDMAGGPPTKVATPISQASEPRASANGQSTQ